MDSSQSPSFVKVEHTEHSRLASSPIFDTPIFDTPAVPQAPQQPSHAPFSHTISDFWFNDGNIIIVCGSNGFRVHRGILAFKSVKFRDIFAAEDANSGHNEMSEGCMVVRLPEDEKDMLRFLGVVYSSQTYFKGLGEPKLTFDIMHSLLKLATKYRFEELRSDIIELLLIMFPSDRTKYTSESPPNVSRTKLDSIFAVEFGVTYHIPAILPAACYEVAMLGMEELFNLISPLTPPGGHSVTLSPQALRICVVFLHRWRALVEEALDVDSLEWNPWELASPNSCRCGGFSHHDRQAIELQYRLLTSEIFRSHDASTPLGQSQCRKCLDVLHKFHGSVRDFLWLNLPYGCGCGSWEDIKQTVV